MKILFCLLLWGTISSGVYAQRVLPAKSKEQKRTEKQIEKKENSLRQKDTELRWDPRRLPSKSKGFPEISAWHTGTAGIVASDAAEISLFNPTRIGFSKRTEILLRIAEEPFLPNIGLKHRWWGNRRFAWATAHTLYYSYPGLKILQSTGFKELVPDSVQVAQGMAMRHEILFSWLLNPQVWGCPDPSAEKILTLHAGIEGYVGFGNNEVMPFDYAHTLYHTQLLDGKVLYYGGLQFDSYWGHRFHYSLNGLFYSVDFTKAYAVEGNLRLTYYVSRHFGLSAVCKIPYIRINEKSGWTYVPLLDLTYLIHPGRTVIRHGLYKNKRRQR